MPFARRYQKRTRVGTWPVEWRRTGGFVTGRFVLHRLLGRRQEQGLGDPTANAREKASYRVFFSPFSSLLFCRVFLEEQQRQAASSVFYRGGARCDISEERRNAMSPRVSRTDRTTQTAMTDQSRTRGEHRSRITRESERGQEPRAS